MDHLLLKEGGTLNIAILEELAPCLPPPPEDPPPATPESDVAAKNLSDTLVMKHSIHIAQQQDTHQGMGAICSGHAPRVVDDNAHEHVPAVPQSTPWESMGGAQFEPMLQSGAMRLLDSCWLVEQASHQRILRCRQDLPEEAFVPVDVLKRMCTPVTFLPIIAISYPWLTPSHPDPLGEHLQLVARVLSALAKSASSVWGVFWDFGSLHQHREGLPRTEAENECFKQGLGALGMLYSHPWAWVFRLTALPPGYPERYELPEGANRSSYSERGWTFVEASWAQLSKSRYNSLDLGRLTDETTEWPDIREQCTAGLARRPPLSPWRFGVLLETKKFTNGKDDKPLVLGLYRESFARLMGSCEHLAYASLGWGDREVEVLADVIGTGVLRSLKELRSLIQQDRRHWCEDA